jgi:hypothetical protein
LQYLLAKDLLKKHVKYYYGDGRKPTIAWSKVLRYVGVTPPTTQTRAEVLVKRTFDAFQHYVQNCAVDVMFPAADEDVLQQMMQDGRSKNLLEGVRGKGANDRVTRKVWEKDLVENAPVLHQLDAVQRPTYGALRRSSEDRAPDTEQYGEAAFVLKPHVRERVTFCAGNSDAERGGAPLSDVSAAVRRRITGLKRDDAVESFLYMLAAVHGKNPTVAMEKAELSGWGTEYFEAQVWGGLDFYNDVEEIRVDAYKFHWLDHDDLVASFKKLRQFADKFHIPIKMMWRGEETRAVAKAWKASEGVA